ncbi:MAG: hypothetical protein GXO75_08210 [Calditrichaeota bacterium]|nr:hypothetical protein [Calditrichota bacterium]
MSIHQNPYLSQIMSAVDMIAEENLRKRELQRSLEAERKRQEEILNRQRKYQEEILKRQETLQRSKNEYDYWKSIADNENIDPAIRQQAYMKMGELIGMVGQSGQAPVRFETYKLDPEVANFFRIPADANWTREEVRLISKRYRELTKKPGGARGGKVRTEDPIIKRLNRLEQSARERYEKGVPFEEKTISPTTGMPETKFKRRAVDEQIYAEYLDKIEMLRKKRESGNWTKKDEEILNKMKTFDLYRRNRSMIKRIEEKGIRAEPEPAHKKDPLGIRGLL